MFSHCRVDWKAGDAAEIILVPGKPNVASFSPCSSPAEKTKTFTSRFKISEIFYRLTIGGTFTYFSPASSLVLHLCHSPRATQHD